MAKFNRAGKKGTPGISTASLPDIVFMLLFFFMVSTTMKDKDPMVSVRQVSATQLTKLDRKDLVTNISIGKPMEQYQAAYGKEDRIELNGMISEINKVPEFVTGKRQEIREEERDKLTVSLKIDRDAKMGLVTAVKQELRKASALKISYSAMPK